MIIFKIIVMIAVSVLVIVCCVGLVLMARLYKLYNCHKCKYCEHYMTYKGIREREEGNVCLFHCEHCGAWEEVLVTDLVK